MPAFVAHTGPAKRTRAKATQSYADQLAHEASERRAPPSPFVLDGIPASIVLKQLARHSQVHIPVETDPDDAVDLAEYELNQQVARDSSHRSHYTR
jgi:hypothetical protein